MRVIGLYSRIGSEQAIESELKGMADCIKAQGSSVYKHNPLAKRYGWEKDIKNLPFQTLQEIEKTNNGRF